MKKKKGYSEYENPNAKMNNAVPVQEGSVIVSNLSNYEELPAYVKDHKRESVVVLKDESEELGVVYIHGKKDVSGKSRAKKEESGLWQEIEKNGQEVYVDIDIKITDAKGKPIKQGKVFQNTGIMIDKKNMDKVEKHIYGKDTKPRVKGAKRIIRTNRAIKEKKKTK